MDKFLLDKIKELIEPILEVKNYELVDIEYKPSPEGMILSIYIDKDGGVSLKDCEDVSMVLSAVLDAYNFIQEEYILEVSSPGIYRELKKEKDFMRYIGHRIKVKLYSSLEIPTLGKQKILIGELKSYSNNLLKMCLDDGTMVDLDMKLVAKVNLEPNITDLLKNKN